METTQKVRERMLQKVEEFMVAKKRLKDNPQAIKPFAELLGIKHELGILAWVLNEEEKWRLMIDEINELLKSSIKRKGGKV